MERNKKTDWSTDTFDCDGWTVYLTHPGNFAEYEGLPVVYSMAGDAMPREFEEMRAALRRAGKETSPFCAVSFEPIEWNRDFAPWDAPPLYGDSEPFTGSGRGTLDRLLSIKSLVGQRVPASPRISDHALLGYSLSGLFALWAIYESDAFGVCACCSGSLWFDGWMDYMRTHSPHTDSRIYLSLGKKEEKARNRRLSAIGDCAREAHALLKADPHVRDAALIWHDGGHTYEIVRRMAGALGWILGVQ